LIIAAVATSRRLAVYTSDPHFDQISELRRHNS
jgi:predicted nucleic acid-binding protein